MSASEEFARLLQMPTRILRAPAEPRPAQYAETKARFATYAKWARIARGDAFDGMPYMSVSEAARTMGVDPGPGYATRTEIDRMREDMERSLEAMQVDFESKRPRQRNGIRDPQWINPYAAPPSGSYRKR